MFRTQVSVFGPADHFPLGTSCGIVKAHPEPATPRRPLGLVLARRPRTVAQVDHARISYDTVRQIGVAFDSSIGQFIPLARHTDGRTGTLTNDDGHQGRDSDTDHRED
jgi:putative ATP-grasp target RiPP